MPETDDDGKPDVELRPDKFWIAYAIGSIDHPIVGAAARTPLPDKPENARFVWQPYTLWMWMLEQATHKPHKRLVADRLVHLKRGQFAASQAYISKKTHWARKSVRVFLERLVEHRMIEITLSEPVQALARTRPDQGQGVSIVTICNYGRYQRFENQKGQGRAKEGPRRGQGGARVTTLDTDTKDREEDSNLSRSTVLIGSKTKRAGNSKFEGTDGVLPFSVRIIHEVALLDDDVEGLIEAYFRKTAKRKAGQRIVDPDAYLLKMAHEKVAKRDKITVAQVVEISTARTQQQRATAEANVVGAFSRPSEETVRRASRYSQERATQALANLAGKSFPSQAHADAAFNAELVLIRFRPKAAAS